MEGKLLNQDFLAANVEKAIRQNSLQSCILPRMRSSQNIEQSFILTYGGKLPMASLGQLVELLRFRAPQPLELLTPSAGETAVGDDRAALGLAGVPSRQGSGVSGHAVACSG